jgi:hypothetical protein
MRTLKSILMLKGKAQLDELQENFATSYSCTAKAKRACDWLSESILLSVHSFRNPSEYPAYIPVMLNNRAIVFGLQCLKKDASCNLP